MRPVIIFTRVHGKPEYNEGAVRWRDSYTANRPEMPHDVVIVNRYADHDDDLFDGVASHYLRYDGGGWDCGTWKHVAQEFNVDLLVCFNSSTRIQAPGWLERIVNAVDQHGPGLYGPLTSFEVNPHVRTPCFIFQPEVLRRFPEEINDRQATYQFECMGYPDTPNVTQWVRAQGWQTRLITWDGCYDLPDWRKPENIFRRGDQSNLLVHDRHCDFYANCDADYKKFLEALADGRPWP